MSTTGLRGFDHTIQETNEWLKTIETNLGIPNKQVAYHALRGVFFALRDRLTVDEALNFSAQLPMLLRGLYFEGYKVSGKPEKYHVEEFLARVHKETEKAGYLNAEEATRAVFDTIDLLISRGEVNDIYRSLPADLRRLWQD